MDQVNGSLLQEILLVAASVAIAVGVWFAISGTLGTLQRLIGFLGKRWRARRPRPF